MLRRAVLYVALAAVPTRARAEEGLYVSQSLGVGMAKGALEPTVGRAMESRLALGARLDWFAFEAWVESDVQTERTGGVLDSDPAPGRADLEAYGFAVRAIAPLYHARTGERLEGYVRLGPSIVGGTGMLEGYRGLGMGGSVGIAVTGKVRALGFLWAPLFFVKKGPKITGSLFLDQGWDVVRLERDDARTIRARVGHVVVGFALGQTF